MKNFISLITLLLLPIVANHAHGVTIIGSDGTTTIGSIYHLTPTWGLTIQIKAFDPIGQTFKAEGNTLESFTFLYRILDYDIAEAPITLSIYAGIGNGGPLIGAETFSLDIGHYGLHAVNFSPLGSVFTIGDQYSAMVTTTSARWGLTDSSNGYADGEEIYWGRLGIKD